MPDSGFRNVGVLRVRVGLQSRFIERWSAECQKVGSLDVGVLRVRVSDY